MEYKLISHLTPTVSMFADNHQYILIVKNNSSQPLKRGHHMYFISLTGCLQEFVNRQIRSALANGADKTVSDMVRIIQKTRHEVLNLLKPFENIVSDIQQ